jgi:predicted molibdopterin-dependent oxidoreductase YjgC
LVEVINGAKKGITTSCTLYSVEGLEVITDTEEIKKHRKVLWELYLAQAPNSEKIQEMAEKDGVFNSRFKSKDVKRDKLNGKCVLCGLCVRVCSEVMGVGAISFINRGFRTIVNTPYLEPTDACLGCKACVEVCPTKAIESKDMTDKRLMLSWSETTIDLNKCKVCGKYFTPERLNHKVYEILSDYLDGYKTEDVCPECRKKLVSKRMTLIEKGDVNSHAI